MKISFILYPRWRQACACVNGLASNFRNSAFHCLVSRCLQRREGAIKRPISADVHEDFRVLWIGRVLISISCSGGKCNWTYEEGRWAVSAVSLWFCWSCSTENNWIVEIFRVLWKKHDSTVHISHLLIFPLVVVNIVIIHVPQAFSLLKKFTLLLNIKCDFKYFNILVKGLVLCHLKMFSNFNTYLSLSKKIYGLPKKWDRVPTIHQIG